METFNRSNIIWHEDRLPSATRKALRSLSGESWLGREKWYLAGGTALALQAGHRSSVDLDFFTHRQDFAFQKVIKNFSDGDWVTDIAREGTLYGRLHNAKTSFIAYPFFVPRRPRVLFGKVPILDSHDIAVMKIIAISQRGRKRDFVDLYWLCQYQESLATIFSRLSDQYPSVAHDYHHIVKSITYFDDAEHDPMPKIFFKADWSGIKRFFRKEAVAIARELLL